MQVIRQVSMLALVLALAAMLITAVPVLTLAGTTWFYVLLPVQCLAVIPLAVWIQRRSQRQLASGDELEQRRYLAQGARRRPAWPDASPQRRSAVAGSLGDHEERVQVEAGAS